MTCGGLQVGSTPRNDVAKAMHAAAAAASPHHAAGALWRPEAAAPSGRKFNHERHEAHEQGVRPSADESFNARLGRASEVDQEPQAQAGGLQVIQDLRPMLGREFASCLEFNDDPIKTNEVGHVGLRRAAPL